MQIKAVRIRNFKSIKEMFLEDIENALILVGKNSTGKTAVLDAIRTALGSRPVSEEDFQEDYSNIEIQVELGIEQDDLEKLHREGAVSKYRRYEIWEREFRRKIPSYRNGKVTFEFIANREGKIRYSDGGRKNNVYLPQIFPQLYYIDIQRNVQQLQNALLLLQEDEQIQKMRSRCCMFDRTRTCSQCFSCIGLINQKNPGELDVLETAKLLEYKLYQLNLNEFSGKVNQIFRKNGGKEEIRYSMNRNIEEMLTVTAEVCSPGRQAPRPIEHLGKGMRSIYMLSLLQAHAQDTPKGSGIILVEEPEIFLHPQLQKISEEILYSLSLKNQVIFSTHSPNLLPDFNSRQIRQIVLDEEGCSQVREKTDISVILDDLGYTAGDLMNVDFVFIVEGKQDKNRLPLLLEKYYSEVYDREGRLFRIAIIATNSCTNIKTYANLKYMNQIYLKDRFLMIRDGDGKDSRSLKSQLCRYYEQRNLEESDKLPRVTPENVLILQYYSFENYFLNPRVMMKLQIIHSEDEFYEILFEKWKEYLHRIKSGQKLQEVLGRDLESVEDVKKHMEEIRIHIRGHNLYDIFYGRYKNREQEILRQYIEIAPREEFGDILDGIESFIYFQNRKKEG